MTAFPFVISATDGAARTGVLKTSRGDIRTPAFMPVGTAATVKALTVDQVASTGVDIILGNTYHLMLRPGAEQGGPAGRASPFHALGQADPDELRRVPGHVPVQDRQGDRRGSGLPKPHRRLEAHHELRSGPSRSRPSTWARTSSCNWTSAWPGRRKNRLRRPPCSFRPAGARCKAAFGERPTQALFGIQQGSTFKALRQESADRLMEIGFDGYALGGLAVGEGHEAMCEVLDYAPAMLPADRPRYLMGVGKPIDLVEAVARGVDMFDCVLPTRSGRHGQAWTWEGSVNLKNARFAEDDTPLDPTSDCPASSHYSKAYLHHLVKSEEILSQVLLSWHNIAFFQALTAAMRLAISEGRFAAFVKDFRDRQVR